VLIPLSSVILYAGSYYVNTYFKGKFFMDYIRLDKFISENTSLSRSQARDILKRGLVSLNGIIVRKSDLKINPNEDSVSYDGKIISYRKNRYIILNKPAGYVCSTDDPDNPTVLELVPPELRKGIFPAGRLDKDSEGMVLLTDDGQFSHRILTPAKHIPKFYIVKLAEPFKIQYINLFAEGMKLSNGEICCPAQVYPVENHHLWAIIRLCEGKYHQVKRMFACVGNHVEYLFRFCMGNLQIPEKLGKSDFMELMHKDVEKLFQTPDSDLILKNLYVYFSSYLINK